MTTTQTLPDLRAQADAIHPLLYRLHDEGDRRHALRMSAAIHATIVWYAKHEGLPTADVPGIRAAALELLGAIPVGKEMR